MVVAVVEPAVELAVDAMDSVRGRGDVAMVAVVDDVRIGDLL